jgi:transglutaminase-like putative cysteine protease
MKSRLRRMEMLMGLVACLSFLLIAGNWLYVALPLTLAILASWWVPQRYSSTPRQQRALFSAIGLPFLVLGIFRFIEGGVVGFQSIAILGAVYVLLGAVLELYREAEQARPAVFHAGIATVMLVGGLTRANPYYIYGILLYSAGLVGLLRSPVSGMIGGPKNSTKSVVPKAPLLIGFVLAVALSNFYFTLVPKATRALYDSYAATLMGELQGQNQLFGASSDLSTIQNLRGSDEISARVFGDPTYLRGQVLVSYGNGRWSGVTARAERDLIKPKQGRFDLTSSPSDGATKTWRIEPVKIVAGPLPVPAGAVEVVASLDELELDPFDGLVADNEHPYQILATGRPGVGVSQRKPQRAQPEWNERYLQLPEDLREPLKSHALRILGQRTAPINAKEVASQLESYLGQNGRYDPGAEHPRRNPILHFLDGDMAGHCEYFATSMTLLLRSLEIPARYVVGYNAAERNPWGDYLIVRDRDAHAWVEVYLDGEWLVFDPTPAGEREQSHPDGWKTPTLAAIWDYIGLKSSGFWRWISGADGSSLGGRLLGVFALLGVVLLGLLAFRFRATVAGWFRPVEPLAPLEALGQKAYTKLAKRGLSRAPEETPLELAVRARSELGDKAARWLESYAKLRFGDSNASLIDSLARELEEV